MSRADHKITGESPLASQDHEAIAARLSPPGSQDHGEPPPGSQDHEAIAARIRATTERGRARPGTDRELVAKLREGGDHRPVMPRVGDEQDRPGRAEIALLGSKLALRGLDVAEARLRLDRRVERAADGGGV